MPLMVVPAGLGAGFGVGFDELGGGGVAEPEDPGFEAEGLVEPAGAEFDAVAGVGTAVVPLADVEAVPPHPTITTKIAPKKPLSNTKTGTERISQF